MGCTASVHDYYSDCRSHYDLIVKKFSQSFDIYSRTFLNEGFDGITLKVYSDANRDLPSFKAVYEDLSLLDKHERNAIFDGVTTQEQYLTTVMKYLIGSFYSPHKYSVGTTAALYLGGTGGDETIHTRAKPHAPSYVDLLCTTVVKSERLMKFMQDSLRVVCSKKLKRDDVLTKLRYRVPINIGGRIDGNSKAMKKYLGYTLEEATKQLDKTNLHFGLSGLVYHLENKMDFAEPEKYGVCGVVNVYGINLEDKNTKDFKQYASGPQFDLSAYSEKYIEIGNIIIASVRTIIAQLPIAVEATIRIPFIGQGAYLTAIESDDVKKQCNIAYAKMVLHIAKELKESNVFSYNVALPSYSDVEFNPFEEFAKVSPASAPVLTRLFRKTSLFDAIPSRGFTILVNAWDDKSFIGNGGFKDFTVDGMMVSGSNGLSTTAYLQNPQFNPDIFYRTFVHYDAEVAPARGPERGA